MKFLNHTIAENDFGSHYLYLYHDQRGKILEVLNVMSSKFSVVIMELMEAVNLSYFYDLTGLAGEGEVSNHTQIRPFRRFVYPLNLWTTLPNSTMYTRKIGDRYFARINLLNLLPNIITGSATHFLYIDRPSNNLIGFTDSFYKLFSNQKLYPENMLGKDISEYITPSPKEILKNEIEKVSLNIFDKLTPVYRKTFPGDEIFVNEELPLPTDLSLTTDGLRWEAIYHGLGSQLSHYITIPVPIDTFKNDFKFTIRFKNLAGAGPLLILGGKYVREDELPDNNGYLVGRDRLGEAAVLKRIGFITDWNNNIKPFSNEQNEMSFCKVGRNILVVLNGKTILSYSDNIFISNNDARLSVGLRKGDSCIINSISVHSTPADSSSNTPFAVVTTKTTPVKYFEIEPYFNPMFQEPEFRKVSAWFIHDITEMNNRIHQLDKAVRFHMNEGKRLKTILSRYEPDKFPLIGSSKVMEQTKKTAQTVARSTATILIEGPTGSGKEVLSRYIHDMSDRKDKPFVKVDCATIPVTLMESRLFGHEKGTFTGAVSLSRGLFELANHGTIFLDEVENIPEHTQIKLLQFLEDFTLTRLGGNQSMKLDVRCIAATNVSLSDLVKKGEFREDLYYRINTVVLTLLPLSEHKEDIPELALHFLEKSAKELKKSISGFTPKALKLLSEHNFVGNIRELKNAISRAVIFCDGNLIDHEDIQFVSSLEIKERTRKRLPGFHLSKTDPSRIRELLEKHNGRLALAAKDMGVTRMALYHFLRKHNIDVNDYREGYQ